MYEGEYMNIITKSDPITGLEFKALSDNDGNLVIETAFNQVIKVAFDKKTNCYMFQASYLEHHPIMSLNECAEYLGVTKVRVSRMCKNGTLKSVKIKGALIIDKSSIDAYKKGS